MIGAWFDEQCRRVVGGAALCLALAAMGLSAGCEEFLACPIPDPVAAPATRADLPGTWLASVSYNETTPFNSAQNEPLLADALLHFDADGDLLYIGLLAPGQAVGLWQVDFAAGQANELFRIVRTGLTYGRAESITAEVDDTGTDGDPNDPNTSGVTVRYALRAHQGFGVVGFDLTWELANLRIDPTGEIISGLLTQTERDLTSPAPARTSFGGTVWLRKLDVTMQEPAATIEPDCDMTARAGGSIPHPVGAVFDLDASGTTGPDDLTYRWTVERRVFDAFGRLVNGGTVGAPDGVTSSFTADAAGTYFVRCWITDGTQWVASLPLVTRVEDEATGEEGS